MDKRLLTLITILILLASCAPIVPQAALPTQQLGTATNTPFALWTQFVVTVYRTPVLPCPICAATSTPYYTGIPVGTLTFTPQPSGSYVTTKDALIYNNQGVVMMTWKSGTYFTTGDWVKNGRLYLGPTLPNRWIAVGDYVRMFP